MSRLSDEATGIDCADHYTGVSSRKAPADQSWGEYVNISKDQIVQFLKDKGQSQQADQAAGELPDQVDPEQHADLLSKFGIDPKELLGKFGGSLSNLF